MYRARAPGQIPHDIPYAENWQSSHDILLADSPAPPGFNHARNGCRESDDPSTDYYVVQHQRLFRFAVYENEEMEPYHHGHAGDKDHGVDFPDRATEPPHSPQS